MQIGKAGLLVVGVVGCAGPVEISRVLTVSEAAQAQSPTFTPTMIVREGNRIPLPRGARIVGQRAVLARTGDEYVHTLAPDDVIETDDMAHIVGVRSMGNDVRFVPGTATSEKGSDVVHGTLASEPPTITLHDEDVIEMSGKVAPGNAVPGGGHVETHRLVGPLIGGAVLFAVSYLPAVYIASQASSSWNQLLYVPFAGPWLDLANRPGCTPPVLPAGVTLPVNPCIVETISRAALVAAGALQGLGAVLAVMGFPSHSEVIGADRVHVSLVPTGTGLAAFGRF